MIYCIDMNTFGRKYRVSIFGESHGELIGVVLDGVPAGLELSEDDFDGSFYFSEKDFME